MFDMLIKGGTIIDGSGASRFTGDIGITGRKIEAIGLLEDAEARDVIDARGKIVCPGFVDIHSHADLTVPQRNHAEILKPLIMQGVTTFIGGNCGFSNSLIPDEQRDHCISNIEGLTVQPESEHIDWKTPAEFMEKMQKRGMLLNMGLLAGHGSLRIAASGLARRLLSDKEQERMAKYLETSMEMGFFGMSSGLQYFPGLASDTAELVRTAGVLKKYNGIFTSHMRSYAHTLDNALEEVFEVGRKNDIRILISHLYWQPYSRGLTTLTQKMLKLGSFLYNRARLPIPIEKGLLPKLRLIENARNEGLDVYFDLVPTSQGFTTLFAFFPPYVVEGSRKEALNRLQDRTFRKQLLHDIENVEPQWPHNKGATWSFNYIKITGWGGLRVMAVTRKSNQWMEGKTFPEIGAELHKSPIDVMCDLMVEEEGKVLVFHTPTHPDDPFAFRSVWKGMVHPLSVPATDTILIPFGRPAHVFYDCFPRFIDFFVKKKQMLSLENAVRKCTCAPAEIMRIPGRGKLEKGYHADIVIFNFDELGTAATFYQPGVHPTGIKTVIINGKTVLQDGSYRGDILAGEVLKAGGV